ncbi:hypothetical protein PCASD_20013 [Puccinia coronata f. sp. avenae]|uniref:Uncharacterized protein n=1 Tax=Puccinia coronata f. sp. avenae TaxID=200324 RepID=A0A2N5TAJ1_9BASI|nr:hypothetical protein PCASD_20013 [Puccinia coronata f. sp. avenae]
MALAKERSIPLALTPSSAFVKRENSLPLLASMSFEQLDTMKIDEPYNPHQGVAAFEIHLGAPSIACLERVLQPVPFPPRKTPTNYLAERATIEVPNRPRSQEATTTSMIAPEPTKPTTELQANSPLESQELPSNNLQPNQTAHSTADISRTVQSPQIKAIKEDLSEVDILTSILNNQWALFMTANSSRSVRLMKIALLQAVSTQEILKNLVGFNAMMSISEYWNARDELTRLDAFIKAQEDAALSQMTTNPDVQIQASTRPPPLQQQLERLSSGPPQGFQPPITRLPPPPSQHAVQSMAQPHHLGHPPCNSSYFDHTSRPSPRYRSMNGAMGNWRRRRNMATRMMEIGDFFTRADQALGRVNRQDRRERDRHQSRT